MTMNDKMDLVLSEITSLKGEIKDMKGEMSTMNQRLISVEDGLEEVKLGLRETTLMLENETNKNIRLIAEGHLSLERKVDEAIKGELSKDVMTRIEVNILKEDVRKIKEHLNIA